MSSDLNCFCVTCRKTIANSGGTYTLKNELQKVMDGEDKGLRLTFSQSRMARKCKRAGHDLVWEYL